MASYLPKEEVAMAQERLTMRKIREIIRLKEEGGLSNRSIARACKVSNSTVGEYLRRAKAAGLGWPLPDMSEDELYLRLFPERESPVEESRPLPDWQEVRGELRTKGVTLRLLWMEYIEKYPNGYRYTQYCEYYRRWKKAQATPRRRKEHLGGEEMQVDYAGVKMRIVDPKTGEIEEAPVFVASLTASNYTYAEAQRSENQSSWNNGHVRAFDFFGGVVRIVKPDNLKTGILKPNYYEPDVNLAYQELAEHYHFAVIPARVKKPRDKGKVENSVQNVERWVIAPLRKRTFFSLEEANQALRERLKVFNQQEMKHVGCSRYQEYLKIDRPNLKPLPERYYEYANWKKARVHIDYHVAFEKHFYSVPYALIHEEVEIRATEGMIVIFHKGKQVAVHPRQYRQGRFTTQAEHMPPNHRFVDQINADRLICWATEIGPQTAALVAAILQSRPFPEQAYRSCLGVLNLAKKYPRTRVEQACQSLLSSRVLSYQALKAELEWLAAQQPEPPSDPLPSHENIRGKSYYQ